MADMENGQLEANDTVGMLSSEAQSNLSSSAKTERHNIVCPVIGPVDVTIRGNRAANEVIILTLHDLGCDSTMYNDFIEHPHMMRLRERTVWVNMDIPGQGQDAPDLPADYVFPTMQKISEDIPFILDALKIKEVVCFGEGAGANILARFASANSDRILGVVLIHCTGTTAGFMESIKDKMINWKLDHEGMNPSAESYLVLHRFGSFSKDADKAELKDVIESYQSMLRNRINAKNLKAFVNTFLKRTNILDKIGNLSCPALIVTGQKSVFRTTTSNLHQALVKVCKDKGKVDYIEVAGVANVIEERPEKLAECFQYFLQGVGLVSSLPMHHISRIPRMRSLSMEEYDQPKLRNRTVSGGSGNNQLKDRGANTGAVSPTRTPTTSPARQAPTPAPKTNAPTPPKAAAPTPPKVVVAPAAVVKTTSPARIPAAAAVHN